MKRLLPIGLSLCLLAAVPVDSTRALTPDELDLRYGAACEEKGIVGFAAGYVEQEIAREADLIAKADLIVLGAVRGVHEYRVSGPEGSVTSTENESRITLEVHQWIRGDCGDTLQFWQSHLPANVDYADPTFAETRSIRYQLREEVLVLLYGVCGVRGHVIGNGATYRYLVKDGVVTAKGIPLEVLLEEIRSIERRPSDVEDELPDWATAGDLLTRPEARRAGERLGMEPGLKPWQMFFKMRGKLEPAWQIRNILEEHDPPGTTQEGEAWFIGALSGTLLFKSNWGAVAAPVP